MRVASDFRELARRALSGKWVSAVLTTLVASILGADIMVNGGSSTSGITNSVTNVVNRGNGDSSYNGILSTMSITSLTYILGAMMAGNKWRLFCLQFSFIGWQILCILSLGIGFLWLTPYMNAATAAFYDEISREPLN